MTGRVEGVAKIAPFERGELLAVVLRTFREGLGEFARILAAGFGHVGPTATTSADELGGRFDAVGCAQAAMLKIFGDGGRQ